MSSELKLWVIILSVALVAVAAIYLFWKYRKAYFEDFKLRRENRRDYQKWKKENPKSHKFLRDILKDCEEVKGDLSNEWE